MDEKIYQIAEQIVQIYRKACDVIEGEAGRYGGTYAHSDIAMSFAIHGTLQAVPHGSYRRHI